MPIGIERYVEPSFFIEEIQRLFSVCFLAREAAVASDNAYVSFRLGRMFRTLRRMDGEVGLFENICRHRFNLIDPLGAGTRPFRCGYHGWTYNGSGRAAFIPLREAFSAEPAPLQLYPYTITSGLVFQGMLDAARVAEIARFAAYVDVTPVNAFHAGSLLHRCNWKLLVENVLEGYHLSSVHRDTFGASGFSTVSRAEQMTGRWDSVLTTYPHQDHASRLRSALPGTEPGYRHVFIFPNLFLSGTNGLVNFVSSLWPVSHDETEVRFELLESPALCRLDAGLREHIRTRAIEFTNAVLAEDKEILERVQAGMSGASGSYTLGSTESRIRHFHEVYGERMEM